MLYGMLTVSPVAGVFYSGFHGGLSMISGLGSHHWVHQLWEDTQMILNLGVAP